MKSGTGKQRTIPRGRDFGFDPNPRLVLFDLDNTLCDHAASLHVRLHHAFEPLFSDPDAREEIVQASIERATDGTNHFDELLADFGISGGEAAEEARARYISDRYRGLKLYDDTLSAIDAVKQVATVGMITNGPTAIQQPKIDLLEIEAHFEFVLISESVGIWKPDPGIFEMALELGSATAEESVYVGDSPVADVPGAHAVGMTAVWINRAGIEWPGGQPPDVEVRDLNEFLSTLDLEPTG